MLTNLHLQNFKSWADTGPIRLAPITAFFGANSSGKSSILHSLLLLRQTTESADRNRVLDLGGPNSLVDLGTYDDIVFRHSPSRALGIDLQWNEASPLEVIDLSQPSGKNLLSSTTFGLNVTIDLSRKKDQVDEVTYSLGDARFWMRRQPEESRYELGSEEYDPPPSRFYGFPDQVRSYYQNADFLADLELSFEQACGRLHYLGPLREDPKRQYIFAGGAPSDVGRRGEFAIDALIASQSDGTAISQGNRVLVIDFLFGTFRIVTPRHAFSRSTSLALPAAEHLLEIYLKERAGEEGDR